MISSRALLFAIARVVDGKLLPGDPNQPTYIDLKPEREQER
jgi:hypothetical protein